MKDGIAMASDVQRQSVPGPQDNLRQPKIDDEPEVQSSSPEGVVRSTWRDQAVWAETANRLKRDLTRWRTGALIAGVLGAFLATLSAALGGADENWEWLATTCALAGAVVLAVVPYVTRTKASQERVRQWVRARSTSEALKEEIYRYLVAAPPYAPRANPADLISRREEIKEAVKDLNALAAEVVPPEKELLLSLTRDEYVAQRVNEQIEGYYVPKGRTNARIASRLHEAEFILGLIAVVLAAMAGAAATTGWERLDSLGAWVAVVTTAGAAVTAHLAAGRFNHQAMTYFATANRLTSLRDVWHVDPKREEQARFAQFVDGCENAISIENEAWLAEWTRAERAATKDQLGDGA
jgi:hypothetical protein